MLITVFLVGPLWLSPTGLYSRAGARTFHAPPYVHIHVHNYYKNKKHFKNQQRSRDAAAKEELIQVEYIGIEILRKCIIIVPLVQVQSVVD